MFLLIISKFILLFIPLSSTTGPKYNLLSLTVSHLSKIFLKWNWILEPCLRRLLEIGSSHNVQLELRHSEEAQRRRYIIYYGNSDELMANIKDFMAFPGSTSYFNMDLTQPPTTNEIDDSGLDYCDPGRNRSVCWPPSRILPPKIIKPDIEDSIKIIKPDIEDSIRVFEEEDHRFVLLRELQTEMERTGMDTSEVRRLQSQTSAHGP
ncbi:unnamed protein product [Caenorhabditis brenneri]